MKNFVFIDVFTQKLFGENFGSKAIFSVSDIRENLMNVSATVIDKDINYIALKTKSNQFNENDLECMMDTEIDSVKKEIIPSNNQVVIEKESYLANDYFDEIKKYLELHKIETVFIYGLPFEEVIEIGNTLKELELKVWIVVDCTKSNSGNERERIKDYQKDGLKMITFRNLENYLKM